VAIVLPYALHQRVKRCGCSLDVLAKALSVEQKHACDAVRRIENSRGLDDGSYAIGFVAIGQVAVVSELAQCFGVHECFG
jgi:hypothetical protein